MIYYILDRDSEPKVRHNVVEPHRNAAATNPDYNPKPAPKTDFGAGFGCNRDIFTSSPVPSVR